MAITVADLKFFQSERMTDESDGGGQMTANEIVSGQDNQIFDDISDVDRAAGDVSIRKVYAAVTSETTDKYLDAGVVIFQEPADPAATVLAFSTGDYFDERDDLKDAIENTIVRGARWNGWLWGAHFAGQRAVTLWQRPEVELPASGQRMVLVKRSNSLEVAVEYLWVTRITNTIRTQYAEVNGNVVSYSVREVILEISEALTHDYGGLEPTRADPAISTDTSLIYDTRYNAEAVALYGIRPTVAESTTGDYSIQVDSLYEYIIPTSLSETALADLNPGGDSPTLVSGNDGTISFTTTEQCIKPNVSLYCGTGIQPGTLSISVSGSTITDDNGAAVLAAQEIGEMDYGNGLIAWNDSCPNYSTASKTVTFTPAAKQLRVADTDAQSVTTENRGYIWVRTLLPIPAPETLRVAYRVNNKWYILADLGGGLLRGVDSSYGSGTLNFDTGTVTLTTGELPDVDSEIIYTWGTAVGTVARGGDAVDAPAVRGQTTYEGVREGHFSVSWTVGVTTYTVDDDPAGDGLLTGTGGSGAINYETGVWWVRPTTLPPIGTVFTASYDYGTPDSPSAVIEATVTPVVAGNDYTCILPDANILQGSLKAEYRASFPDDRPYPYGFVTYYRDANDRDDGAGSMVARGGTVNYAAGTVVWNPLFTTDIDTDEYEPNELLGWRWIGTVPRSLAANALSPTTIAFKYRLQGTADWTTADDEAVSLTQLVLDLTRGYDESVVFGSVRFRIGTDIFVERAGQIYRNPDPITGVGTLCGTLDATTGRCYLSAWTGGIANAVTVESLVTSVDLHPVEQAVFRTPISPLRSGSFQLRYTTTNGVARSKTVDGTGVLEDAHCTITVNHALGVVAIRFGLWKLDSDLTPQEKLEPWYDPDLIVVRGGHDSIWKPEMVQADSIIYNAVAQIALPPDSELLGINAARLPPDGKGLIFNRGRLVLVHHTDTHSENSLSPTQQVDMGRVRLYRVVIDDVNGQRLPASFYSVARDTGIVTMATDLNLTGYTGPYTFSHTVADLGRLVDVDINGTLTLNKQLSHTYPADDSRVSGMMYVGNMQARYTNLFAQTTWTSVWSDSLIGSEPLAQYNDVTYPLVVTNRGAYQDRFVIRFTSSTAFGCYGENLGYLGAGNINENFSPINPLTGEPYFTIDYRGWGGGWSTGNCVRFNLISANYPVALIRAVQPSEPTGEDDSVELLFVGNVDA